MSGGERERPSPPVLGLGCNLRICPFPGKGRWWLGGARERPSRPVLGSWRLGYHLPLSGRAGAAVATSLGVLVTICPFPDKGRWCPEASGIGLRRQSWGLGSHPAPFQTRVAAVWKRVGAAFATSLGSWVLGSWFSSCPLPDRGRRVAGVRKRVRAAVATCLGVLASWVLASWLPSALPGQGPIGDGVRKRAGRRSLDRKRISPRARSLGSPFGHSVISLQATIGSSTGLVKQNKQ